MPLLEQHGWSFPTIPRSCDRYDRLFLPPGITLERHKVRVDYFDSSVQFMRFLEGSQCVVAKYVLALLQILSDMHCHDDSKCLFDMVNCEDSDAIINMVSCKLTESGQALPDISFVASTMCLDAPSTKAAERENAAKPTRKTLRCRKKNGSVANKGEKQEKGKRCRTAVLTCGVKRNQEESPKPESLAVSPSSLASYEFARAFQSRRHLFARVFQSRLAPVLQQNGWKVTITRCPEG
eukprot:CAMPEP_0113537424 /NCGR_PEP_ID=MMETSP0015_2-20120614/6817_1 /TAXON_ID=2838 /ORGANISM="Odontella" /LENGTH=236 /DNA_ID=CAMNT_0000436915 /DNA_START=205 /DNA_END=911 /DNA_ORIENTATION=- /assembly_acc=CAM_ASM_000160